MIYVLVKDSGVVISKETYEGDTTVSLDPRKLKYPQYVYEEVTKETFDATPNPEGNYLLD